MMGMTLFCVVKRKGGSMDPSKIRITGPLSEHLEGFWSELLSQGYTPLSIRNLARVMSHLSRWLKDNSLSPEQLSQEQIEKFLRHQRRKCYKKFCSKRGLKPILGYLEQSGILSVSALAEEIDDSPLGELLKGYSHYLTNERSLCKNTVQCYVKTARDFLGCFSMERGGYLSSSLTAASLSAFVLKDFRKSSIGCAKVKASALRSILRYLFVHGHISTNLAESIPSVAGWRLSSIPKALSSAEAKKLLRSCDRRTHVGRRDFAVILLMLRLGLRVGEVAALELGDIHWARGEIRIRGKGRREDLLPLPEDIGESLASYIRLSRPRMESRKIFARLCAPRKGLGATGVKAIVNRACKYVGISPAGTHRLRHTAATGMLSQGVPLSEIAQVLRHRHLDTTAIYAKVDRKALRALAQPWLGGGVS